MSIKGISDVERLPRIGKIRLGIKNQERGYPEKTDYFIMDPDDDVVLGEIKKIYGDKPKALDIMFASEDEEQVFPQYLKRYSYGTLVCKGDGESGVEKEYDENKKLIGEKKVSCEGCKHREKKKCKSLASLMVLLPKVPGIGVFQLDTSSYYSITGINAGIKLVRTLYKRISGIPLRLLLNPKTVTADGRAKVVYILSLSMAGTLEQALKGGAEIKQIEGAKAILPAPDEEAGDHFQEDEGEDHEELPEELVDRQEHELEPSLITKEQTQVLSVQGKKLGYAPAKMTAYIEKEFGKKASQELTETEADDLINKIGRALGIIDIGLKAFKREQIEAGAAKMYKVGSLLELADEQMDKYEALMVRSSGKK